MFVTPEAMRFEQLLLGICLQMTIQIPEPFVIDIILMVKTCMIPVLDIRNMYEEIGHSTAITFTDPI